MGNNIAVDKNNLNRYKLKITALSPIHIGTGEVYEPTNYVIDENKLFAFDEVLFYKSLSADDKTLFNNKLTNYMSIIDFYKTKKEEAKKISHFECEASNQVQQQYDKTRNKNNTKNQNQLEIQTTFKNPNTHRAIISGSSIKGMLNTVLQIYSSKEKENTIRQNLIISDALLLNGNVEIGKANRRHRDINKTSKDGIYQFIEVIKPKSEFIFTIDTKFTFEDIKKELKRFHSERKNSRYQDSENSFVTRIGKNEGKDYIVNDGRNVLNNDKRPVATHFLYTSNNIKDEQFGWIKIELISDDDYKKELIEISRQEQEYYNILNEKQKDIKQKLLALEKEKKEYLKIEKENKLKKENIQKEKEEKEKARLESLSPLDLKIDNLKKLNSNDPFETVLLKAIEKGQFDDDKKEAIEKLKEYMIDNKIYKETSTSKNPKKDKKHQKTLQVIALLNNL